MISVLKSVLSVFVSILLLSAHASASQSSSDSPMPWCKCGITECRQIIASYEKKNCECSPTEAECHALQEVSDREHEGNSRAAIEAEQLAQKEVFLDFGSHLKTIIVVEAEPKDIQFAPSNYKGSPEVYTKTLSTGLKRTRYTYRIPKEQEVYVRGHRIRSNDGKSFIGDIELGDQTDGAVIGPKGSVKLHPRSYPYQEEIFLTGLFFPIVGEAKRYRVVYISDLMTGEATYLNNKLFRESIKYSESVTFRENATVEVRGHVIEQRQNQVFIDGKLMESPGAIISRFGGVQYLPNDINR